MSNESRNEGDQPDPMNPPQAANDAIGNGEPAQPVGERHGGEGAGPAAAAPAGEASELERLRVEASDLKDRLLRTHAEMENVRKRLEREKAEIAKFAITKFAKDVIGIGDNVQRAIDSVPADSVEQTPALQSFIEGVRMIEREFVNVLERHGIKRVDPKGEPFNPHFHQAVMEMPVADVPSGTVAQVFQSGYTIEERVLRPAMVVVAKGGMKPQAAPAEAAGPAAGAGGASQDPQSGEDASAGGEGADGTQPSGDGNRSA